MRLENSSAPPCPCANGSCPCFHGAARTASIVTATASLSLLTVAGNLLVMLSIRMNRRLQTVHNCFVFSLALADLLVGLVPVNLYALYLAAGRWPLGAALCDLWLLLDYVVSNASVLNLLLISLDRYFCVTRPLSYPARRGRGAAGLMIAGAWLLPLLLWAPPILRWQTLAARRPVPEGRCYLHLLASPALTLCTTLLSFYLPAGLMLGLYARIAAASRRRLPPSRARPPRRPQDPASLASGDSVSRTLSHCRTPAEPSGGSLPPATRRRSGGGVLSRERKVTNTVRAILLVFILTWTPYNVLALVGTYCRDCVPGALWAAGYWLCYLNSALNPGLYALFNATFRSTFLDALRCRAPP